MVSKSSKVYNKNMGKARMLIVLFLLCGFVFPRAACSQSKTSIVVLPFTGGDLSRAELADLTLSFEESLSRIESLQVIDQTRREKVLAYLDPALLTSEDLTSAVKVGEALSAAIVVMGTVRSESGKVAVRVRVITVATRKTVSTESTAWLPRRNCCQPSPSWRRRCLEHHVLVSRKGRARATTRKSCRGHAYSRPCRPI